ncbi:GMC family oxidoreductase [Mycolicibacterium sp. YH-1]|uniref:GMC family oxidoreductase n=1 Tax=Mycolicibacterium sp. YH-1 TaxID=2908837 RepID=UPI001F4BE609|nr:GMC oxidoreductase [Mycolicibacterium sp. YH-1]UNB52884.1 GMC family oxidoreductase N-terminal domain-containing protein [Mycolicibacterium sp. YH-1]
MTNPPEHAATIVVGAGTSGATLVGHLIEAGERDVLLIEAGPDYGARGSSTWPEELLDARAMPTSHDWGYTSDKTYPDRTVPFDRAKVIGGCSSHNSCVAIWGSHLDYEQLEHLVGKRWGRDSLEKQIPGIEDRMRLRRYQQHQLSPFHEAFLAATANVGIPIVDDVNDLDQDEGASTFPVNIDTDGTRFNAAFAYVDPVREHAELTVLGDALVDRVLFEGSTAVGVEVLIDGERTSISADRVIISGGTYGTPGILMRSGIGPADHLRANEIDVLVDLPGVGANLHDHPAVWLHYAGSGQLETQMADTIAAGWTPEEQSMVKLRSRHCDDGFDLHLYPMGGPDTPDGDGWHWVVPVANMRPLARGVVRLADRNPETPLAIDHNYLGDADGRDLAVLADGVRRAREITAAQPLTELIGAEITPGDAARTDEEIAEFVRANVVHYYHPVGTCKMGTSDDAMAVCSNTGAVFGTSNLYVADCSLLPEIPRGNTNLPAVFIGATVAAALTAKELS